MTVLELARLVLAETGAEREPEISGLYRVGDTRHIFSAVASLRALGWEPHVSWEEGVARTIAWYAENRSRWIGRVDWLTASRAPA